MTKPPGNSLDAVQQGRVAEPGESLAEGLYALLERIASEIEFSDAKGTSPYRLGVHDGLRFAEEAVANLLRQHDHEAQTIDRALDA